MTQPVFTSASSWANVPSPLQIAPDVPVALSSLQDKNCSLVGWRRDIPPDVTSGLGTWVSSTQGRVEQLVHSPSERLSWAMNGLTSSVRSWLHDDIQALLEVLFDVAAPHAAAVKFGVVTTNQCRKFHVDYVNFRLITTYLGPGTDWLTNDNVNRDILEDPPEDHNEANALIVKDTRQIRRAAAGEVLLMKGARHDNGVGLVHRSPPIENTGAKRAVLVISPRVKCAPW